MSGITPLVPIIRPYIGTRHIGENLCLIQQQKSQVWLFGGISRKIWHLLKEGNTVEAVIGAIQSEYKAPREKVITSLNNFFQQLWERQIVDIQGHEHVSDSERAAMVKDEPCNTNGKLWNICFDNHVMFRTWLDLLIPCNLRCQHCYLDFSKTDILPFSEVCSYLDQLEKHGCPEVVLTGGEIFLRRDLLDIIAYTQERGFLFELFTNANFIDEKMADRLSKYFIECVQISVYGTTAEIHEKVTRKPGTFNKSINAAKFLIERGIPVRLVNVVQQVNYEDAFRFRDFAKSLGADYDIDGTLMPNRNGSNEPLTLGISVWQMAELHKAGITKPPNPTVACTAARGKGRITAHGDIYPCNVINNASLGNLKQNSFDEIWASPWRNELRNMITNYKPKRCGTCSNSQECVPCAATRGFNQENHMDAPVSEACMITTADLLSRGREFSPDSPVGKVAGGCADIALASNAGQLVNQGLIQITRAN
jgi:radical SAM protein with 4Fe4S-binding SPASM domain